jgi:hypothetical protein
MECALARNSSVWAPGTAAGFVPSSPHPLWGIEKLKYHGTHMAGTPLICLSIGPFLSGLNKLDPYGEEKPVPFAP